MKQVSTYVLPIGLAEASGFTEKHQDRPDRNGHNDD